ncbi:hypothetical protein M3667_01860 [Microbacterium sp. P26]|uniref:hypothetical protein n=1 Tax=Microbacterium TaxID=33882 RepID=UPI002040D032|nr:hypothetical protein [Microbacterium sp. P26]MCM3500623.1 hypothetical protein [Microbacterium sp. P26]
MNDLQKRVDALLPGGDVASKRNRLMKLRKLATTNRTDALQRELNDAVARYAAGEDVDTTQIAIRLRDARNEQQAAQELWVAADSHDHEIRGQAEAIQQSSTLPALALIRSELDALVVHVRELDLVLGDVNNASAAIRAGVADHWRQLEEADEAYGRIRSAQLSVYARIAGVDEVNAQALMLHMGLHSDALVTSADFRAARIASAQMSPTTYDSERGWVEWLRSGPAPVVERRTNGTWLAPNRYRYLRALCALTKPWVPDWPVLEAASHAAGLASAPTNGSGDTRPLTAGRDEYARTTGTDLHLTDTEG